MKMSLKAMEELIDLRKHYETLICLSNETAEMGGTILDQIPD